MLRRLPLLLALSLGAFLPLPPSPPCAAADAKGEAPLREKTAGEIAKWVRWCAGNGAASEARTALAEAMALDTEQKVGEITLARQELKDDAEDTADQEEVERKRSSFARNIAKAYDRLASLSAPKGEEARFLGYTERALTWEPSKGRVKTALATAEKEGKARRPVEAGLLLRAVRRGAPEYSDAALSVEARLAQKDVVMLGSDDHPLFAFVSLPGSWKKGGSYPVLVAVDGAGCGFLGCGRGFAGSRGSRPVIVISPATLSNTNELDPAKYPMYGKAVLEEWGSRRMDFDGPGMERILAQVRERFGGEEKVFVTGFSGGGNYCYWKFISDPAGCRGAAPACANFSGMGLSDATGPGEGGGPPIHIMTGEKDPHRTWTFGKEGNPGIEPQTDNAVATLERLGFKNVRRTMIPGAQHSSLQKQVWEFVDEVLGK